MAITFEKNLQLQDKQSNVLVPLESRGSGVLYFKLDMAGNSLLSTVYASSISLGGSVKVDYFDFTTGFDEGELNPLKSHVVVDSAPSYNKILVSNSHDKVVMRVTISGTVKFSVYGTVVSNTVSDLDAALVLDNQIINYILDKAIPIAGVDRDSGVWQFLSTDGSGALFIKDAGDAGLPLYHDYQGLTDSGTRSRFNPARSLASWAAMVRARQPPSACSWGWSARPAAPSSSTAMTSSQIRKPPFI